MKKIGLLAVTFILLVTHCFAQNGEAKKWFNGKQWLGGLQLTPHKTIDVQELYRQYQANKAYWDKAFAFMREHDLKSLPVGRQAIDGDNVFAIVSEGPTKDADSVKWESHKNYVDLQYVIEGKELIGVDRAARATVTKPYDSEKDVVNYTSNGKLHPAAPGTFFIFFPTDAHRPGITPGGNQPDKKLVIKIRAAK